jgi:hypothetical protein
MGGRLKNEKEGRVGMLDRCYFCKAKAAQQRVTVDYRWGDTLTGKKGQATFFKKEKKEKYF